jgi:hypothetical protein
MRDWLVIWPAPVQGGSISSRVIIPGDKVEEYLKIMAEAEKKWEPFRQSLLDLNSDFYRFLQSKVSQRKA